MSDDKRGAQRVEVNREFATIEEFITEYVSDLSRSGVFIKSDDPPPVGTRVDLTFTVLTPDFETICGIGQVVRIQSGTGGEPEGMGVVFTELTETSERVIERLLARFEPDT